MSGPEQALINAINAAVDNNSRELSERAALEVALSVAEGWKMRLSELDDEDEE